MINRFVGFNLIEGVPKDLSMEVYSSGHEVVIKTTPKNELKEAKWLSEEDFQISEKRRQVKTKEKMKHIPN